MSMPAVSRWRGRWSRDGFAGLEDAPGRGRKPSVSAKAVGKALSLAATRAAHGGAWSVREMATQTGLPLGQGHIRTRTHDYYRHGTVTLFAALDYLSGKVLAHTAKRHRHSEWLTFLKKIDASVAPDKEIHIICDNYATHKHPKVKAWLARRKRFHLHFTPTSSSWLNLVERFFGEITRKVIRLGSFQSIAQLVADIYRYLDHHNLKPNRYQWTADPQAVLDEVYNPFSGTLD